MLIPFTKISLVQDGSFTISGGIFLLATSGIFWWTVFYLLYPPGVVLVYVAWLIGYSSLILTGMLWFLVTKVAPAIRSYISN